MALKQPYHTFTPPSEQWPKATQVPTSASKMSCTLHACTLRLPQLWLKWNVCTLRTCGIKWPWLPVSLEWTYRCSLNTESLCFVLASSPTFTWATSPPVPIWSGCVVSSSLLQVFVSLADVIRWWHQWVCLKMLNLRRCFKNVIKKAIVRCQSLTLLAKTFVSW